MKTNYSEAWLRFIESDSYKRICVSMRDIKEPYRSNILRIAFEAGWNATGIKIFVITK